MYPTCHSSPPLSSSSTLQSPARASGVGGGDAAEAVAKALSRPAAAPSLPCRTRRATTTEWAGRSRRRRSHCGKREVGGGGRGKAAAIGGWTILADRLLISSRCADLGAPHQSRGGGGGRSVTTQMVAMVAASDDGGAGAMQERIVDKEMGG